MGKKSAIARRERAFRDAGRAPEPAEASPPAPRWRSAMAPLAMILGVLAVYVRPACLTSQAALVGMDYFQLHYHRIRYALDALHANPWSVPGWFSREALGTPFLANIQSF